MTPEALLSACRQKGIRVLGSGDALHQGWRTCWEDKASGGSDILVVPSAEVEDSSRIHHLILMNCFEDFAALQEDLTPYSRNIASSGRPHVRMGGEGIAQFVHAHDGLIGPAHAFTPWTSLYAMYENVGGCYGMEQIDFLELGLSADSSYGSAIPDLSGVTFLSNSDAHSPDPVKLGQKFNQIRIHDLRTGDVLDAVKSGDIEMNVGFFPEEGKYNRTACVRCYHHYTPEEASSLKWRCPLDGGRIKKGVRDRAGELSTGEPVSRPPYLHMIPLGELIQKLLGTSSPGTKKCRELYHQCISHFGDEITVLISAPIQELAGINPGLANAVNALRNGRVVLTPGGGGRYGSFSFS